MALKEELDLDVAKIFSEVWSEQDGQIVPLPENIKLANDAVSLDATVLYADMADSTELVDDETPQFLYPSNKVPAVRSDYRPAFFVGFPNDLLICAGWRFFGPFPQC